MFFMFVIQILYKSIQKKQNHYTFELKKINTTKSNIYSTIVNDIIDFNIESNKKIDFL